MYKTLICFLISLLPLGVLAQHSHSPVFIIDSIHISGNIHTDSLIILRELPVSIGQSIEQKNAFLYLDEIYNRLMRTGLFTYVSTNMVAIPGKESHILIQIIAHEKPRVYVIPAVDVYDRNLNVWWVEHHHAFNRIIGGINVRINNLFGQAHSLTINTFFGALNSYSLIYNVPFANEKHTLSVKGGITNARQRIVGFETLNNKQDFLYSNDFERRYTRAFINVGHRLSYRWQQNAELSYYYDAAQPTLLDSNSMYYGTKGVNHIRYADLTYHLAYDTRNSQDYPIKGLLVRGGIGYQYGIGSNNLRFPHADAGIYYYTPINKKVYFSFVTRGAAQFTDNLPYPLQKALGYKEDYISGYEYYVIDGSSYWINKAAIKYVLFNRNIKPFNPFTKNYMEEVPVMLLPKVYFEEGYVKNNLNVSPTNTLNNTFMPGWGLGADVVLYYDINFRFEYSFNNQMKHSLFLHFKSVF